MEHTEDIFTNGELNILRRLYAMHTNQNWVGNIEEYAHKKGHKELWQRFYKEAGKVCLNGGCGNITKSCEIILWPNEWFPQEKAYWHNFRNEEINLESFKIFRDGFKSLKIGYIR